MIEDRSSVEDGLYWIRIEEGTNDDGIVIARKTGAVWKTLDASNVLGSNVFDDVDVFAVYAPAVPPMVFIGEWPDITDARQLTVITQEMVNEIIPIAERFPAKGNFSIKLDLKRKDGKALVSINQSVSGSRKKAK